MSKKLQGKRLKPVFIMANMSANLLRSITGKYLDFSPEKIHLSGDTLKVNETWSAETGVSYVQRWENIEVHSFNGREWKRLNVVGGRHYFNGNHDYTDTNPTPLYEAVSGDEIFFVVVDEGADDHGEEWKNVTLYKSPDFKVFWEEVEHKDVQRWEEWLIKE